MEMLLTSEDIAERLKVKKRTAARYMREMAHMETPLRVTEEAFRAWVSGKTVTPGERHKAYRRQTTVTRIPRRTA